jgi:hypothetical protein
VIASAATLTADHFEANLTLEHGATAYIQAPTIDLLAALVARTKAQLSNVPAPEAKPATVAKAPTPKAQEVSQPAAGKSEPAPNAAATASAAAPAAASTQAEAVSFDDVKSVVNKLYAIKPQHAVDALAAFGVKKGSDLQPQQWPEFVEKARAQLAKLEG